MPGYFPRTELLAPYRLYWQLTAEGQTATIKLEMDLRLVGLSNDDFKLILERLWQNVWAPLQCRGTQCFTYGVTPLLAGPPALQFQSLDLKGSVLAFPSDRTNSVVVTLYGGNRTPGSNRRFYIPFVPTYFHDGEVIKDQYISIINTQLRGLVLGCDGRRGGIGPALIIDHPPVPSSKYDLGSPARFEDVDQVILNTFVDRAPNDLL